MTFTLDPSNPLPLYRQLAGALRRQIALGALRAGERVPTVRELAVLARVNRNTAARAIQALESAGIVTTRVGQGTFVATDARPIAADEGLDEVDEALDEALDRAQRRGLALDELSARLQDRIAAHRAREERESGGSTPEESTE